MNGHGKCFSFGYQAFWLNESVIGLLGGEFMGGFANLKKDFEQLLVVLRPDGYAPDAERDHLQDTIVARYLELRCLFEIAGNLDTIAVEMRAQTKELAGIREEISGK